MYRSRRAGQLVLVACLPIALALLLNESAAIGENAASSRAVPAATSAEGARPARARRSRCQRLRGTDRAPARRVKLVARRNEDDGTDLLGCVLPRGRVYSVASSAHGDTFGRSYRLRQVANAIVLVSTSSGNQYESSQRTFVQDLRTGRAYTIATTCSVLFESCEGNMSVAAAFVNSRGQAVAAVVPEAGNPLEIAGFPPSGRRQQLDSGPSDQLPPSSLRLTGDVATWTHAGEPRSAQLPDH